MVANSLHCCLTGCRCKHPQFSGFALDMTALNVYLASHYPDFWLSNHHARSARNKKTTHSGTKILVNGGTKQPKAIEVVFVYRHFLLIKVITFTRNLINQNVISHKDECAERIQALVRSCANFIDNHMHTWITLQGGWVSRIITSVASHILFPIIMYINPC